MTEREQESDVDAAVATDGGRLSVADRELIDRYLAGRLEGELLNATEARIVGDPRFRHEVELTQSLKSGLTDLQSQGDLAPLLQRSSRFWQRPAYALAASIAVALLGVTSLVLYQRLDDARRDVAKLDQLLADTRPAPTTEVRPLLFINTRGSGGEPDATINIANGPTLLELRLDAGPDPAPAYSVSLDRIEGTTAITVLRVTGLQVVDEREIVFTLHSSVLQAGDYRLAVGPTGGAPGSVGASQYTLRVSK